MMFLRVGGSSHPLAVRHINTFNSMPLSSHVHADILHVNALRNTQSHISAIDHLKCDSLRRAPGDGGGGCTRARDYNLISSRRRKADACSPAAESSHLVPACVSYTNVITGGNSLFSARTERSLSKIVESNLQPEQNSKEHLADPSTLTSTTKPKSPERNRIICKVIKRNRFWFWIKKKLPYMHILKLFIVDTECLDFVLNFLILYYFGCMSLFWDIAAHPQAQWKCLAAGGALILALWTSDVSGRWQGQQRQKETIKNRPCMGQQKWRNGCIQNKSGRRGKNVAFYLQWGP